MTRLFILLGASTGLAFLGLSLWGGLALAEDYAENYAEDYETVLPGDAIFDISPGKNYYIEVRPSDAYSTVPIKSQPGINSDAIYQMQAGELLRVTETEESNQKRKAISRSNYGYWQTVPAMTDDGETQGHLYYDPKIVTSIPGEDLIELNLLIPTGKNVVTVFSQPGIFTWEECRKIQDLCIGWPGASAEVKLLDSILKLGKIPGKGINWQVYYQIQFQYETTEGDAREGVGWIPSNYANRTVKEVYETLKADRKLSAKGGYEGSTLKDTQKQKKEDLVDWGVNLGINYMSFTQTTLDVGINQIGMNAGMYMSADFLHDFHLKFDSSFSVPISNSTDLPSSNFFKFNQWLDVDLMDLGKDNNIVGSVGFYYLAMITSGTYGFTSLLSFQIKGTYNHRYFYTYVKYAPVETSLDFKLGNQELSLGFGVWFNPNLKGDGWYATIEASKLNYTVETTGTEINIFQTQIGVSKGF